MNFQNINFEHVEASRQDSRHFQTVEHSQTNSPSTQRRQPPPVSHGSVHQSLSPQPTVLPYAPTPPSRSESASEIYGPDRHQSHSAQRHNSRAQATPPSGVRFDEAQLAMFALQNPGGAVGVSKDELTLAASRVTPGVDDTPYIQYAIQALTRGRETPVSHYEPLEDFDDESDNYRPNQRVLDEEMGYGHGPVTLPPTTYTGHSSPRQERRSRDGMPLVDNRPKSGASLKQQQTRYEPVYSAPRQQTPREQTPLIGAAAGTESDLWVPVTKEMRENFHPRDDIYPSLTYKPRMIRPFSILIFMILCILMIVALIFTATYADRNPGLTQYPGTIYSGLYFVFRLLPQLLAALILVYAQCIVSTSLRILPFTALASEDARKRYLALFQRLYPTSFFWPPFVGPWQFKAFSIAAWIALFTVPLQSAAFTCILVEGRWIWAPVQGVVWTLVVIYIFLILTAACLMVFWFGQWTGLVWDVRSIGDLIPLLNRSNTTQSYKGRDMVDAGRNFKTQLRDRWFDRLGYWRTEDMAIGGIWYSIGTSGSHADQDPKIVSEIMGKRASYDPSLVSHDLAVPTNLRHNRFRYLPWCLRDGAVAAFAVTASALLLALLIVSFLPQTRLEAGFLPLLPAKPDSDAFSAANFLYSFLPSLLGMVLFLLFQSVDQALRIVQPWGELSRPDGALASKSLLADYAACLPFHVTWRAARAGHWRVAILSLLSTLFIIIPVLAGGLFMALTRSDGRVLMFPSMPIFGVLLAFLFLYVACLFSLLPRRRQFQLPHSVSSLAEMISFISADELTQDAAFRAIRSRDDLETRLGAVKRSDPREESVWFFGTLPGRDEKRLSVRRLKKFTEKTFKFMKSTV